MAMEGSKERRYFSAVAGDRRQQGELFGYVNLFKMQRPGSNLTLDILKVKYTASWEAYSLSRSLCDCELLVCGFL